MLKIQHYESHSQLIYVLNYNWNPLNFELTFLCKQIVQYIFIKLLISYKFSQLLYNIRIN